MIDQKHDQSKAPKIVAIIQGRMSSSRLPGKVLMDIGGEPMLLRVLKRVKKAKTVDEVWVATTDLPSDDPIAVLCKDSNMSCYRGSTFDVLDRFYQTARAAAADVVVRITADCPLIDPVLIDQTVNALFTTGADFTTNRLPPPWHRTYPIGMDVEVCWFAGLERAWREAELPHEREHVMPFFYDTPGRFNIHVINAGEDYGQLRWTVDTPEDLEVVRRIYSLLVDSPDFTWRDVLALWRDHPELAAINAEIQHHKFDEVDQRFVSKNNKRKE